MAGSKTRMAKSTMADQAAGDAGVHIRLLTADTATLTRSARTGRHHHAFWQLDHCAGGAIAAQCAGHGPGHELRLEPGEGLLLPPAAAHDFIYRRGSHFVSWKFTWDGAGPTTPVLLSGQPGWAGVAAALAAAPVGPATGHLLSAAMHIAGAPAPAAGFAHDVGRLVDAHPARAWTVAAIAAALGLSPGHASARFRSERGMALKTWLDARRAAHAGEVMSASDLHLADIAVRLGFADQFAFSRFFRRVTGQAPSAFRAGRT
jgi:AraC-like DNA-binding protein